VLLQAFFSISAFAIKGMFCNVKVNIVNKP
jgi:hypothetical protein